MKALLHIVYRDAVTTVELGTELPYRITRRFLMAHKIGLPIVRTLNGSKISDVAISDGIRVLSSWYNMNNGMGFTGASRDHPLVVSALKSKKRK